MSMQRQLFDLALGSYEAAAIMGVQYSRPKRMYDEGLIDARSLAPVWVARSGRQKLVYSLESCEENYNDYVRRLHVKGRDGVMRPRSRLHERSNILRQLEEQKTPILYADAIGTAEAAKILDCHPTAVAKLVREGRIRGRVPWNPRHDQSKWWIISQKSCEKEAARYQLDSSRQGRPRGSANVPSFEATGRTYSEGSKQRKTHRDLEKTRRNQLLVRHKKRHVLSTTKKLVCEVCRFDFHRVYGGLGRGFAHAHHTHFLSDGDGERQSTLDDLVIVCANCHAMLHRREKGSSTLPTVEKLRAIWEQRNRKRH
jgi:hypothetical protein